MRTLVIISVVLMGIGCSRVSHDGAESALASDHSMREQLRVPEGVMLCIARYPAQASPEVAEAFHRVMTRLDTLLHRSEIDYNVDGYLANMFYIRSEQGRAKRIILRAMRNEPFEVDFH